MRRSRLWAAVIVALFGVIAFGVLPSAFRHTYAHQWLAAGGNEGDLMRLVLSELRARGLEAA